MNIDRSFMIATLIYVIGNMIDLNFTAYGLCTSQIIEANPLFAYTIQVMGNEIGLILPKVTLMILSILLLGYLDKRAILGKDFNAKNILYPASILTMLGGSGWVLISLIRQG